MAGPAVPKSKAPAKQAAQGEQAVAPKRGRGRPRVHGDDVMAEIIRRVQQNDENLPDVLKDMGVSRWTWKRMAEESTDAAAVDEAQKRLRARKLIEDAETAIREARTADSRDETYKLDVFVRNSLKLAATLDPANYSEKTVAALDRASPSKNLNIQINIGTSNGEPQVVSVTPFANADEGGDAKGDEKE